MGNNVILDTALKYHAEGLCVIPVKPHEKSVALDSWDVYQTRVSTTEEITAWFNSMPSANIGAVHGPNNYIAIDVDHDSGIYEQMRAVFPFLFTGRIEQSGSYEGYHLPMFIESFPDLGWDNKKQRAKGNKTWHTSKGNVNIRARWCQTVLPPSIHPSGGVYKFIQDGEIVKVTCLDSLMSWLNKLDPTARNTPRYEPRQSASTNYQSNNVKDYYPDLLKVFQDLGYTGNLQREPNGETRILGNGGLVLDEDKQQWYSFRDECGGDVIDAFGWVKFGAAWDRHNKSQFIQVMRDMKDRAGIGTTRAALPTQEGRRSANIFGGNLKSNYWSVK